MMKVTFMGTGTSQGVPVIGCDCDVCMSKDTRDNRLRTSVCIEIDEKVFVIDAGPDFRQQMLQKKIKKLDAIIFTHGHKDHTGGLDDVRAINFNQKHTTPIYGPRSAITHIKKEYYYAFMDDKYPGAPQIPLNEIGPDYFSIQGVTLLPLPVKHLNMEVFGFRIGNFSYITDANVILKDTWKRIKKSQILVVNALQQKKHISHFNLQEALAVAKKADASKTYFTHIGHGLGLHDVVDKTLPPNVALAYDGLTLTL